MKELDLPVDKENGQKFVEKVRTPRSKLFLDDPPPYVPPIPFPQRPWKNQQYMKSIQDEKEKENEENLTQGLVKPTKKNESPTSLLSDESKKKQVMNQPSQEPTLKIPYPQGLKSQLDAQP